MKGSVLAAALLAALSVLASAASGAPAQRQLTTVTVDTPWPTSGLDVDVVPWLAGVFCTAFAYDRTPSVRDGQISEDTDRRRAGRHG